MIGLDIKKARHQGFTIVELLVVIVVIGVLAAISLVSYSGISQKAVVASLQSDLSTSAGKLKMYYAEYGSYPQAPLDANYCPTAPTADTKYCLKLSNGATYAYENFSPSTFTLKLTSGTKTYGINESSAPMPVAPITAIAAVSGNVGTSSTVSAGILTPSGATASYQWQIATTSNGTYSNIAGATSPSYTPILSDVGKYLRVVATGTGFSTGSVTSSPTVAVVQYATNGNYYISFDGTLRAGANVVASGATSGYLFTEYWSESTGWWGDNPLYAKLANNRGIHLYRNTGLHMLFDTSYLLQNNMEFNPSSTVNIYVPTNVMTSSGWDGDDGNYQNWETPIGVSGSYVTVQ